MDSAPQVWAVRIAPHGTLPHAVTLRPAARPTNYSLPRHLSSSTPKPELQSSTKSTTHKLNQNNHAQNQKDDRLYTLPPHKPPHRPISNLPNRLFNPLPLLHRRRRLATRLSATLPPPHLPGRNCNFHLLSQQHSSLLHSRPQRHYPRQQCLGEQKECYCIALWLQYLVHAQQVSG